MSNKDLQDKDFSLEAIPKQNKSGFITMLVVMLGFTFFSASMLSGGTLGTSLPMDKLLVSILIGNLILCLYTGLLAYIAGDTGLSTHLLARYSFGEKGSYLVSFLLSATQIGWFGVGVAMFAIPVSKITGIDVNILVIVAGLLMTGTAYFGMKSLTILSMIAVPAIAILGSFSIFKAVDGVGGLNALMSIKPNTTISMNAALAICVGSFISGGTLTPDFTRFAKDKKTAVLSTGIAFLIGNSLMFLFGAVGAKATGFSDISDVMFAQGLIIPAIIILGLNIWTTNDNALYASGLGFSNITKIKKSKLVIVNGIVGTVFAIFLYNNFMGWLSFLNSFMPAIGGVIIADYFIIRKQKYKKLSEMKFKNINIAAIISWVVGVLASTKIPGIVPVNSVIVAMISYVILSKILKENKEEILEETCDENIA